MNAKYKYSDLTAFDKVFTVTAALLFGLGAYVFVLLIMLYPFGVVKGLYPWAEPISFITAVLFGFLALSFPYVIVLALKKTKRAKLIYPITILFWVFDAILFSRYVMH
jgi:hypothetical protein